LQQRLFFLNSAGLLYLVENDSGKVLGFFQTSNGYIGDQQQDFADYFHSTPVIVDSTIYFGSGGDIYAVNINDGYLNWKFSTGAAVHTKPAIFRNRLYAGSFDGCLYSIDRNTGNLIWKFKSTGNYAFPKGEFMGAPVVAGGMVFAGSRDYNLYAVDTKGGYCNWMKPFEKGWGLPVTANDSVIYVGTSDDKTLFAYAIRTGKEVWKTDAGFNIFSGLAIGKNVGYLCTLAGKVHGIDLKSGRIIWTIELESYKANHLTYLKADDTYRDDLDKLIKTPLDMVSMYAKLGGIFGPPAIDGDHLVVAGYDGWIYCFSGQTK
jgi:outer membrane protein assembly factor BamB